MAEENHNKYEETNTTFDSDNSDIKDRGVFDFLGGKKKDEDHKHQQEDVIATEFDHKVTLSDQLAETKKDEDEVQVQVPVEGDKKHNVFDKLHRSGSSSSSSSEEEGEDGEKKKKKKKEKKKVVEGEGSVEVEKVEVVDVTAAQPTEEKKGFLEKIKDKLPGHKKTEDPPVVVVSETATTTSHDESEDAVKEKKGILEKIKEKLPGYHPKTTTELDDKDHHKDDTTTSH